MNILTVITCIRRLYFDKKLFLVFRFRFSYDYIYIIYNYVYFFRYLNKHNYT